MTIVDVLIYIKDIHCQYNSMKFVKFDNSITPRGIRFSSHTSVVVYFSHFKKYITSTQ